MPYGAWDETARLSFQSGLRGASYIDDANSSDDYIDVIQIDSLMNKEEVTFIKMDIEGAELKALKGAKNIILRDKPKLAISIYHKPEDIVEIPLFIKELVPEYKLYIRHYSNDSIETVLYAVIS